MKLVRNRRNAPAVQEARASSISEIPVWVHEAISGIPVSTVKKKPMAEDKKVTSENPAEDLRAL